MGINFFEKQVPDATTILKFQHLLEQHNIGKVFFDSIANKLEEHGYMMREGSIIDATFISSPSSTKNKKKERAPEMHQTKKGNKCHVGVDAGSGYVHSLEVTAANIHDILISSELIREDDEVVRERVSMNRRDKSVQRISERRKSSVRSKVEYPFLIVKRYFGCAKTVYRGLAKNMHRLHSLFASANLLMCARAGRSLRPA